jgi:diguanylate cyclase
MRRFAVCRSNSIALLKRIASFQSLTSRDPKRTNRPCGEYDVSDVGVASRGEPRQQAKTTLYNNTLLRVVMPLCVIVALAIACIVIAALTSAQRANDVAVEHEKKLFQNAIVTRGDWSLKKIKTVLGTDAGENSTAPVDLKYALSRVGSGLRAMIDIDYILVIDSADKLARLFDNRSAGNEDWLPFALQQLAPALDFLHGHNKAVPDRVALLGEPKRSPDGSYVSEVAFLQVLDGRTAIVAGVALGSGARNAGGSAPIVLTIQFVDGAGWAAFGKQLQLENLRIVNAGEASAGDYEFNLSDHNGQSVVRFAWAPQRPGAAVLDGVTPFIAITVAGFALLIAVVLRFMHRTTVEITQAQNSLRHIAMHDSLSGLPNRMYFSEVLEATIKRVHAGDDSAAVFYVDLDHFKDVNDTLGHSLGDALICSVTQRLNQVVRDSDIVARLGGDEFAIITPATDDRAALQSIAQRIIVSLCAPYSIEGHTIVIGASIGIAFISQHGEETAIDIMRYADMALYRAKNEGRNRACIYDNVMDADLSRRKQLELELREAIQNDQLDVAYQPVVNASGEKIIGVEALARWSHPERGFISPIEFIPLAEHSGLIVELGEWILRRACRDGKAWPGLSVAVNVSPVQFRQADFVEMVERVLSETGFEASRLELELTESTLIGNLEIAESAMLRLKGLGVRLALDDFGTGYSSLLYLRRFPFDKLKIDRSFVLAIERTTDAAAIVHAIVSLGRGLGMKVTAEGVETAEQHLFLRAAGVHFMQGYRFGRPGSATDIATHLAMPGAYRKIEHDAVAAMAS